MHHPISRAILCQLQYFADLSQIATTIRMCLDAQQVIRWNMLRKDVTRRRAYHFPQHDNDEAGYRAKILSSFFSHSARYAECRTCAMSKIRRLGGIIYVVNCISHRDLDVYVWLMSMAVAYRVRIRCQDLSQIVDYAKPKSKI